MNSKFAMEENPDLSSSASASASELETPAPSQLTQSQDDEPDQFPSSEQIDRRNNLTPELPEIPIDPPPPEPISDSPKEENQPDSPNKDEPAADPPTNQIQIPNNFVTRYLKQKHPDYYKQMVTSMNEEDIPNNQEDNQEQKDQKLKSKIEKLTKVRSKGEIETERLARLALKHKDFETKVRQPMIKKGEQKTQNTCNSGETKKSEWETEEQIDDKTKLFVDQKTGKSRVVTEWETGHTSTRYITPTTYYNQGPTPSFDMTDIYSKMTIDERRKLALSKFIVECRRHNEVKVQTLSWLAYQETTTMAEKLVKHFGWTLPKASKLADFIYADPDDALQIRKLWYECRKMYGIST